MSQYEQTHVLASNISPIQIDDILYYIFQFTNPLELSSSISLVCEYWNKLVFTNKLLWLYNCDLLWKGKFFITPKAINMKQSKPIHAFKMSYLDRQRNVITFKELTSLKWHFKLKLNKIKNKQSAKFHIDGTVTHENINFFGQEFEFKWKFIEARIDNTVGLQRSSRFNSIYDFDIKKKNSTNSNPQTCYGYLQANQNNDNYTDKKLIQSRWIKINNFQPLCAFRDDKKWGWIIQNENVLFTSY